MEINSLQNIRIVEWNINQRAKNSPIKNFVSQELIASKPNIIFLVEYKEDSIFESILKKNGYNVFTTGGIDKKNEVLIAISANNLFANMRKLSEHLPMSLDILSVAIRFNNKDICLIGTRIRVGKGGKDDYLNRKKQLDDLLFYVKSIKNNFHSIIIAGDFNHAQIHKENDDTYSYRGLLQEPFNYQKIKNMFKQEDLQIYTPKGEKRDVFSWVGRNGYGTKYYIKEDHLILSNSLKTTAICYQWGFVHAQNSYGTLNMHDYKSARDGLPDHAKLVANIVSVD